MRLSTSLSNAQFPRLSFRAFQKRMKTNHPCRISNHVQTKICNSHASRHEKSRSSQVTKSSMFQTASCLHLLCNEVSPPAAPFSDLHVAAPCNLSIQLAPVPPPFSSHASMLHPTTATRKSYLQLTIDQACKKILRPELARKLKACITSSLIINFAHPEQVNA